MHCDPYKLRYRGAGRKQEKKAPVRLGPWRGPSAGLRTRCRHEADNPMAEPQTSDL